MIQCEVYLFGCRR